jgi:hypothetical protein
LVTICVLYCMLVKYVRSVSDSGHSSLVLVPWYFQSTVLYCTWYCSFRYSNGVNSGIYRKKENKTPQQQLVPIAYPINREARSTKPHVQGRSGCRDRGPQRVVSGFVTDVFGESWIVAGTLSAMMRAKRGR